MRYPKWMNEEIQELKEMLLEGSCVPEIAKYLKRTERAVYHKMYLLKLKSLHKGTPISLNARLLTLDFIEKGLSLNQISKLRKVRMTTVLRTVNRLIKDDLVNKIILPTKRPDRYKRGEIKYRVVVFRGGWRKGGM